MFWIICFLITMFVRPQDWPGSPVYNWPLNDFIVIGGLIQTLITVIRKKGKYNVPQNYFIVAFVVLVFLSNAINRNFDMGISGFVEFSKRIAIYAMFVVLVNSTKKLKWVLLISVLLACFLAFQGIYQKKHEVGWAKQTVNSVSLLPGETLQQHFKVNGERTYWIGLWDGPNVLALVYIFGLPFCLEGVFRRKIGILPRGLYLILLSILSYGLYLTDSRGGFLAVAMIITLFPLLRFSKQKAIIVLIGLILILTLFATARMKTLSSSESSASERIWLWEQGLNMFEEKPFLGIGKGQFPLFTGLRAHNNFVSSMTEMGFLGLFIYTGLMYFSLKSCQQVIKQFTPGEQFYELVSLARVVLISSAGFYLATFFVVMEHDLLFMYWALSACIVLLARQYREGLEIFRKIDIAKIIMICFFVIIVVWLVAIKEIV